jgi:hypothetical protein
MRFLYHERYQDVAQAISNALVSIGKSIEQARSATDLDNARNQVLMIARAIEDERKKYSATLVRLMDEGAPEEECISHYLDYKPNCMTCRMITRQEAA